MHSACSIWRAQSVTCPLRSPLIPAEGHSPQCLNPRMLWKLWCPTNHLPPETWGPVFTNCVSSDRSGCICCPIFCEKNNKIFNHQSHTENVRKCHPAGIQFGLAACARCYSMVYASSTPFSEPPLKPHPSQRNRNMETAADHNFVCFIFKPPGQVFNLVTVPLPTTVW